MNFTPGEYLVANLIFVTLIVASYIFVRKGPHPPVQLNLKRADPPAPLDPKRPGGAQGIHNPSSVEYRPRNANTSANGTCSDREAEKDDIHISDNAKELNVLFQWNGHTWDAYEVLGIPAGSSTNAARTAHDRLMAKVDPESRPFIAAAYAAVSKRS